MGNDEDLLLNCLCYNQWRWVKWDNVQKIVVDEILWHFKIKYT